MSAAGMLTRMAKVPHGLPMSPGIFGLIASAFTTALASPASAMMMMNRMAMEVTTAETAPDARAHDLRQRQPIVANRGKQDDEIMHPAGQHRPDKYPQRTRQKAELRRQHRPNQRPRPGNGRKMVPKEHPPVHRLIIHPIGTRMRRRDIGVIQREHFRGQKGPVIPISQRENTQPGQDQG